MIAATAKQKQVKSRALRNNGWEDLAVALHHEARLLGELREALLHQRAGVAKNDVELIENSIQAMGRTLHTIQEARGCRRSLIALLTDSSGTTLGDVEKSLGIPPPPSIDSAKEAMRVAASAVAQEAAINQHVIRRALDAGESYIQCLFSAVSELNPVYDPKEQTTDGSRNNAMLVNRRA